jgi:addiction module HigA family antidote
LDALEERGISQREAAVRLQLTPKHVNELIKGHSRVTPETARALARVIGSTPEFWMRLQTHYDLESSRLEEAKELESKHASWLKLFPLKEMIAWGWIEEKYSVADTINEVLNYFGIAEPKAWESVYGSRAIAYPSSSTFDSKTGALSAWLREGERMALELDCETWDPKGFKSLLPTLRAYSTYDDFHAAQRSLVEDCRKVGVAVVLVRPPKGCVASGATYFLGKDRAVLVLSARHMSDDHLWFSFFHEAAHLILHSKKLLFIEGVDGLDETLENEANAFAANTLIPESFASQLNTLTTKARVKAFAEELGISPGVVVGRLQHDGLLKFNQFNDLKVRYRWKN